MKKQYKYILDTVMTIIMTLLMKTIFTGLLWHELLGLGIFFLFIVHNILNFSYVMCILKKFTSSCIKTKVKFGIVLDVILSLVVAGIATTGILISKEIFPFGMTGFVSSLHHSLSYLALIMISVHIGLHWTEIMGAFRKMFHLSTLNKVRTAFMRLITLVIVILGIKGSFSQGVAGKLMEAGNSLEGYDISDIDPEGYGSEDEDDNDDEDEYGDEHEEGQREGKGYRRNASADTSSTSTSQAATLEEYLSNLHCNGCGKHCPLSAPQCGVGERQAIEATRDYEADKQAGTDKGTTATTTDTAATTDGVSLDEYLSKLFCNGCSRHCPLSAPQCGTGERQAAEATAVYYQNEGSGEPLKAVGTGEILVDFLPIMGMYIAGTHYLLMLPKYLKERK